MRRSNDEIQNPPGEPRRAVYCWQCRERRGLESPATCLFGGRPMCAACAGEEDQRVQRLRRKRLVARVALENGPAGAQPEIMKKEGQVMKTGGYDKEALIADYLNGKSVNELSGKYSVHHTTVRGLLKSRGVYKPGRPQKYKNRRHTDPAGFEDAIVRTESQVPQVATGNMGETPTPRNGRVRCRVAMFEVEGSETAVRDAVNAIKAALENRSA